MFVQMKTLHNERALENLRTVSLYLIKYASGRKMYQTDNAYLLDKFIFCITRLRCVLWAVSVINNKNNNKNKGCKNTTNNN
jgi:hypothetical protein